MKTFKEYLQENSEFYQIQEETSLFMNEPFIKDIKKSFEKYFKDSYIGFGKLALSGDGLTVRIALGRDKTEWENGISHNDPMINSFMVFPQKDGSFSLEASLAIKSLKPKEKYMAYSSEKIRTRKLKFQGDEEGLKKALETFDKYFKALHDVLKKNLQDDNFFEKDAALVKRKI